MYKVARVSTPGMHTRLVQLSCSCRCATAAAAATAAAETAPWHAASSAAAATAAVATAAAAAAGAPHRSAGASVTDAADSAAVRLQYRRQGPIPIHTAAPAGKCPAADPAWQLAAFTARLSAADPAQGSSCWPQWGHAPQPASCCAQQSGGTNTPISGWCLAVNTTCCSARWRHGAATA